MPGDQLNAAPIQRIREAEEIQVIREQQAEPLLMEQRQEEQQEQRREQELRADPLQRFQQLPDGTPAAPDAAAPAGELSYKERKRQKAELKKNWEQFKEMGKADHLLKPYDVQNLPLFSTREGREKWASTKPKHSKLTLGETARMVREGDYSNFENMDGVFRNLAAGQALRQLIKNYDIMGTSPEELCRQIQAKGEGVSALLDPTLRLGLSLAQRSEVYNDELKERFRKLDEAMSTAVMLETLTHQADRQTVARDIRSKRPRLTADEAGAAAEKAIEANNAQKIQIAKRLLLMHLGNLQRVDKDSQDKDVVRNWDKPVAVALSHCSRVTLTMPRVRSRSAEDKAQDQRMWKSIFYQRDGSNPAQDHHRASSTHSIRRRKVGGKDAKENKVLFNLIGQRGMNVAVGGLGNAGVSGKTLSNDGSCGHFYSMYKTGDTKHCGAMLMGLESDSAGVTNQMGHTHDIHATAEKASSLGGQRTDEVGKKYGGRVCDLSGLSAGEIAGYMEKLEDAMKYWQEQPGGLSAGHGADAMRRLTGSKMSMDDFLREVEPHLSIAAAAYRNRGGYVPPPANNENDEDGLLD